MTTFSSQRQLPEVAQAESRLLDIFNLLGRSRIPDLEVGEFCDDLDRSPGSGHSLESWEEQIGVRLGLRILDQVIFDHFSKQEELGQTLTELQSEKQAVESEKQRLSHTLTQLKSEKQTVVRENKVLKAEIAALKHSSETKVTEVNTVGALQEENKRLKSSLAKLMKQCDGLTSEITRDPPSSSRPSSVSLPVPATSKSSSEVSSSPSKPPRPMRGEHPGHVTSFGQSEASSVSRKRKTPSPQPPAGVRWSEKEDPALGSTPKISKSTSRVFSRKLSPNEALLVSASSTQLHISDPSFVPDTLQVTKGLATPKSSSSCRRYDQDNMEITVPDTPERSQEDPFPPSANIEPCVTPEAGADPGALSPLIKSARLKSGRKMVLVHRKEVLRESNCKEDSRDVKTTRKLSRRKKEAENSAPMSLVMIEGDEVVPLSSNNPKKVERITPSAQSEIDKKSYRELDHDFATTERAEKTPEKKRRIADKVRYFPSDTDSDFESPNLLARGRKPLRPKPAPTIKETGDKKQERKDQEVPKVHSKFDEDEDIDVFASPPVEEIQVSKPVKAKSVKAMNRWGIEKQSLDSLTDSEKRKFSSNRQSKINVFFKNPPQASAKDEAEKSSLEPIRKKAVRVSHADMDMERALKLSRDAVKVKEQENKSPETIRRNEDDEIKIVDGVTRPKFAHVGPAVRGKEERKKLYGFDCPECQEYYQQKLEEGLTKDQILMLMNKCSKHRGLFKPPLTPERFWDADILEDDPDDPRVKTQPGKPLRTRAIRRAEVKSKKKALNME